ncbi:hypothetical protein RCL_jg3801.t1 [Rhizophagus clarus]|nr:hypothetical protein RCL_jg3801.t1 [Rhizophagus clarus]
MVAATPVSEANKYALEQFFKWFCNLGINADNCPQELTYYFITIYDSLTDKNKKLMSDSKNPLESYEKPKAQEMIGHFKDLQAAKYDTEKEMKPFKNVKANKTNIGELVGSLDGEAEEGKKIFEAIERIHRLPTNTMICFLIKK